MKPARIVAFGSLLVVAAVLGFGAGFGFGISVRPPAAPLPPIELPEAATADEAARIALFERARDSVVSISTAARSVNPWTLAEVERPLGAGSGFFWDASGHVVTNNHVIEGASSATVALADGRVFPARLVGRDPRHDLAVLRVDARGLPAPLSPSTTGPLSVGQNVLAIGNPFGLDWTLTTGIVSALDRTLEQGRGPDIRGLVQTDAAINPGNSGGPLLDAGGELVGVNTAIYSPSGASAGIGFAVPVSTVSRVVPQLIETGRYVPPDLGLVWDERLNAAANRQGLEGVVILDVRSGTAAAREGIEPASATRDGRLLTGDVIVGIEDRPVRTLDDLLAVLDRHRAGDEVTVQLSRNGREREVTLPLEPGV